MVRCLDCDAVPPLCDRCVEAKESQWSGQDFAKHMGVDPATVSRWEAVEKPQAMGATAERLLRLAVAHGQPVDEYPISTLAELDDQPRKASVLLGMKNSRSGWQPAAVAA